ncbi:MAG TPA: DUF6036 family nucleotidyltransferase [Jatrophihabitans sp.]|jgi:hypothetical protein|nr:DUF6036 family nucleotidyltransferase [Jatrophihabitans sp.]
MLGRRELEEALETLGAVLEGRGLSNGILIVGGSSLLLLGLISRPTADLDVIGLAAQGSYVKADPIPPSLAQAVRDVAVVLELIPTWLNNGPAALMDLGLPMGYEDRIELRRYGSLDVHIPGRVDLICFKLYAAVDQGPGSKHFQDLQDLAPTPSELSTAADWCQSHDPSSGFESELRAALADLTSLLRSVGDDDADS